MLNCSGIILLDVGGTFVKSALGIAGEGVIPGTFSVIPISSAGTSGSIISSLRESVIHQRDNAEKSGCGIASISVAIPGPFDFDSGKFLMKHKFEAVYGRTFKEILGDTVPEDVEMKFVHDVNAALMGAIVCDESLKEGNVGLTTFGTGLGFSYAHDGQVLKSPTGSPAVSLWNVPYLDGKLEEYVSRQAILRFYQEAGGVLKDGEDVKNISFRARIGDAVALASFQMAARHYSAGVRAIVAEKNIRKMLFAGQISKSFDLMEEEIRAGLPGVELTVLDNLQTTVFSGLMTL